MTNSSEPPLLGFEQEAVVVAVEIVAGAGLVCIAWGKSCWSWICWRSGVAIDSGVMAWWCWSSSSKWCMATVETVLGIVDTATELWCCIAEFGVPMVADRCGVICQVVTGICGELGGDEAMVEARDMVDCWWQSMSCWCCSTSRLAMLSGVMRSRWWWFSIWRSWSCCCWSSSCCWWGGVSVRSSSSRMVVEWSILTRNGS